MGRGRPADAEAGVNLVSLGSSRGRCSSRRPGRYDVRLARPGPRPAARRAASASTSPPRPPRRPAWLFRADPQRPARRPATGVASAAAPGRRFCPSSPDVRRTPATAITERSAERYGEHPAVALWHVHNEYGGVNSAVLLRHLRARRSGAGCGARYGDLDALNAAWGTAFWGQRYGDWDEIDPPRHTPIPVNPAQELDYLRCSDDTHLANYRRERDMLRAADPRHPGHHQLHDRQLQADGLLAVGPRGRRRRQRPLPAGRAAGQPHRAGHGRRPDPGRGRRASRGC